MVPRLTITRLNSNTRNNNKATLVRLRFTVLAVMVTSSVCLLLLVYAKFYMATSLITIESKNVIKKGNWHQSFYVFEKQAHNKLYDSRLPFKNNNGGNRTSSNNSKKEPSRTVLIEDAESLITYYLKDTGQHEKLNESRKDINKQLYRNEALRYFFAPKMNQTDRQNLLSTLRLCLKLIEQIGIRYFIYSGTLIGYFRHNASLIPWDDDADCALLTDNDYQIADYVEKLNLAMLPYSGSFALTYVAEQRRLKCYGILENNSRPIEDPPRKWRWPFVDLQFMKMRRAFKAGYFKPILVDASYPDFRFSYHDVYPLRRVYFSEENVPVYIPNDVASVLSTNYDINECVSSSVYDHRREKRARRIVTIDCDQLSQIYNFTNL